MDGIRAWAQAVFKNGDKRIRDLRAGHGLVLAIPVSDPVQRPGESEGRHLRIARMNRAVLNAVTDETADVLVDIRLQRLDMAAHGR